MIGEVARRTEGKYSKTVRLLRDSSHNFNVSNVNTPNKTCSFLSCDQLNYKVGNLERHLKNFKERDKQRFPKERVSTTTSIV